MLRFVALDAASPVKKVEKSVLHEANWWPAVPIFSSAFFLKAPSACAS